MAVTNKAFWHPHADVYEGPSNPSYAILSCAQQPGVPADQCNGVPYGPEPGKQGTYICLTSALPLSASPFSTSTENMPDDSANQHMACGHVTGVFRHWRKGTVISALAETTITRIVPGSSGSPVYKGHTGYGTEIGIDNSNHHMIFQTITPTENSAGVQIYGF
jgi:hypothetical protein